MTGTLALLLLAALSHPQKAKAEQVELTPVRTEGAYSMRSDAYGDRRDHPVTIWEARSSAWEGPRRAYCVEPDAPLSAGTYDYSIWSVSDLGARRALALIDELPVDLAQAVALEAMAGDDMDLRTGKTRFAVPHDWGGIKLADGRGAWAWRLSAPGQQDLVVVDAPWDRHTGFVAPVYREHAPADWWSWPELWAAADRPREGSYYIRGGGESIEHRRFASVSLPSTDFLFVVGLALFRRFS